VKLNVSSETWLIQNSRDQNSFLTNSCNFHTILANFLVKKPGLRKSYEEFLEGIDLEVTFRLGPELGILFITLNEMYWHYNTGLTFWQEQLKSQIPARQKKWQTANFCNMNVLPCRLAKMQNWSPENMGEKTPLKTLEKLDGGKYSRAKITWVNTVWTTSVTQ
jgi:hypothetical protein